MRIGIDSTARKKVQIIKKGTIRILNFRFWVLFNVNVNFSTFKILSSFLQKGDVLPYLKSWVVYEFTCAGCNSSYMEETNRYLALGTFGNR